MNHEQCRHFRLVLFSKPATYLRCSNSRNVSQKRWAWVPCATELWEESPTHCARCRGECGCRVLQRCGRGARHTAPGAGVGVGAVCRRGVGGGARHAAPGAGVGVGAVCDRDVGGELDTLRRVQGTMSRAGLHGNSSQQQSCPAIGRDDR